MIAQALLAVQIVWLLSTAEAAVNDSRKKKNKNKSQKASSLIFATSIVSGSTRSGVIAPHIAQNPKQRKQAMAAAIRTQQPKQAQTSTFKRLACLVGHSCCCCCLILAVVDVAVILFLLNSPTQNVSCCSLLYIFAC